MFILANTKNLSKCEDEFGGSWFGLEKFPRFYCKIPIVDIICCSVIVLYG